MKNLRRILAIILLPINTLGFEVGAGSEFQMLSKGGERTHLSIYYVGVKETEIDVEFYFRSNSIFSTHVWQQFKMERTYGAIKILSGHRKLGKKGPVELMEKKDLQINKGQGVELSSFLFSKSSEINKYFVGDEKIEVPAGSLMTKHYRKSRNGQIVDFWIADEVKPIGLVKLVSKNEKIPSQNYAIELLSLLKNVAAGIDPRKVRPLSQKARETLKR